MSLAQPGEGFGHAPAYMVPGLPWVSGSVVLNTTPFKISFPKVTKFIHVNATSGTLARVGFTENGINGSNFYRIASGTSVDLDLRVCEMYIRMDSGSGSIDIIAGLTTIPNSSMGPLTGSSTFQCPGAGWQGVG